ncbi:MAG: 1-acyl-sn-glycerol-3-phosphate acyltransferase [Spirochaetes bacterium]|nr:1-acyl-sn-glycerol-3-phosphate acyltransferase [Spirochaetota bacterium]
MREIKPIYYLYKIYKYLIFIPLLLLSTSILGVLASVLAIVAGPKIGTWMGVIWSRFNSLITPMFVKVTGKEHVDRKQSYVIVANHQSQYDIFVIYGWLPVDFRWVMKIQLRQIPFLGYACHKLGHVYIDRSNPQAAKDSINAAKERIRDGTSILFFPEGTRSSDGLLHDFKKGAFVMALDMGLPLLPLTIIGTRNVLPNNTADLFPGRVKLIIHPPIPTEGYDHDSMPELMERAWASIQRGLEEYGKKG